MFVISGRQRAASVMKAFVICCRFNFAEEKKIGQTVYVVRYHFNEDAKETMQEKINRMLVTEASRMAVY